MVAIHGMRQGGAWNETGGTWDEIVHYGREIRRLISVAYNLRTKDATYWEKRMRDVAAFYDTIADEYDAYYIRPVDVAEDHLTSVILHRHIQPGMRVLDVGCGTGHTLTMTQPTHYTGIDISNKMLLQAKSRWPGRTFVKHDMEDLSFAWYKSFDVVTCLNEVGLYAVHYGAFVRGLFHASKGSVILSVPLHESRRSLTDLAPSKGYMSLSQVVEPFDHFFSKVKVTTYSSWLHDRVGERVLSVVGVRWPCGLRPYYCIVEATV